MKSLTTSFTILILGSLFFSSCSKDRNRIEGQGPIVTKTLQVSQFSGVDLAGAMKVIITQGPVQEVKAVGQSNIIDRLETDVHSGIWEVQLKDGSYEYEVLTIYITVPSINLVSLSGSGNINIDDFDHQTDLAIDIKGSGNLALNEFNGVKNISVDVKGAGDVFANAAIAGVQNLNINITGTSNFVGFPIETRNCYINIVGSGNCDVKVKDRLDVVISGSGNVHYLGHPTIYTKINAAGHVISAN